METSQEVLVKMKEIETVRLWGFWRRLEESAGRAGIHS